MKMEEESGLVIQIEDITNLEKKDAQLRQAQKMESIGNLASGLAHDFNNALGGIIGTVSLLHHSKNNNNITNERLQFCIETIEKSAKKASGIVDQLMSISRHNTAPASVMCLSEAITNVLKICETTFDKSIEIKFAPGNERAYIIGDATQIEQVLLNIFVNASHAMTIMRPEAEHEGGTLSIKINKTNISGFFDSHSSEMRSGKYWNIRIHDTGIGIPKNIQEKIFDPFFTTKQQENGTGLGLSMVYNIINSHNGSINLYSEQGEGTTFNIYLPAIDPEKAKKKKDEPANAITKGKGKILIVDDEDIMLNTASLMLEEAGYSTTLCSSGSEAIEIYKKSPEKFDAVILDMSMPKLSGKETYIEMKKINPEIKAIIASGFENKKVDSTLALGANAFIRKPYEIYQFTSLLAKVISE
jgi:signal transduction histidine kinase